MSTSAPDPRARRGRARHLAATVTLFLLLAIVHTWPLATKPGGLSRHDNADAQLNEWIIAWVAHQLPRRPLDLFDGNIFHPARDTLAFSEPLVVPALAAAPLFWMGASPVLAHNVLLIVGFAASGLAAYLLLFTWTGDRAASLLGGSLYAFNAHTLTRLAHLQGIHAWGLPLALLYAERLLVTPGWRPALGLATSMTATAYTSGYLLVFASLLVAIVVVVGAPAWWRQPRRVMGALALAAVVSGLAVLPLAIPYRRVAVEQHMVRSVDAVREHSASPASYVTPSSRLHTAAWGARFGGNADDPLFPGLVALGLAAYAIWRAAVRRRDGARVSLLCAIGAGGIVLSLGLQTPAYGWVYAAFPPMHGLRAAARFGNLFLLAVAGLAAIGLAGLRRGAGRTHVAAVLAIAAILAVNAEALRAPFTYRPFDGIPRIYTMLAEEPGEVVLAETPFYPAPAVFENAEYVLNSTAHWRPLMNGYSGYTPDSYREVAWTFWHFPDDHAVAAMREHGVTHVTLHPHRYGDEAGDAIARLARHPDFELLAIAARSGIRLYRLR
jgi:hypothetical protein